MRARGEIDQIDRLVLHEQRSVKLPFLQDGVGINDLNSYWCLNLIEMEPGRYAHPTIEPWAKWARSLDLVHLPLQIRIAGRAQHVLHIAVVETIGDGCR